MNTIQQVQHLGQSIWYDNISRGLIESGGLQDLIDLGVSGLTSNPTIFEKAISGSTDYDDAILGMASDNKSASCHKHANRGDKRPTDTDDWEAAPRYVEIRSDCGGPGVDRRALGSVFQCPTEIPCDRSEGT